MELRNERKERKGNPVVKADVSSATRIGRWIIIKFAEPYARKAGMGTEKAKSVTCLKTKPQR